MPVPQEMFAGGRAGRCPPFNLWPYVNQAKPRRLSEPAETVFQTRRGPGRSLRGQMELG